MLHWIASNGGPLMLLERELLASWSGTEPSADSTAHEARFRLDITTAPSDYDRACSVQGTTAIIPVGDRDALVLAGEPFETTWIPRSSSAGEIVRWEYAQ